MPPMKRPNVLVVEDSPLLLLMAIGVVEDAGFHAISATTADEAVAMLESRPDIRLVFTDVDMPGSMDGMKLAAAVRDRWPPIEIIVVSGYRQVEDGDLPSRARFFSKPYDAGEVTAAMREMVA